MCVFDRESTTSSQDSMREDSYISSVTGDHLSESTAFSSLDNDTHAAETHTPTSDTHLASPPHTHSADSDSHVTHTPNANLPSVTASDDDPIYAQIQKISDAHTSAENTHLTHPPIRETHQSPFDAPLTLTPASDPCDKDTHLVRTSAADAQLTHILNNDAFVTHAQAGNTHLQVEQSTLTDTVVEVLRHNKRDRSPMRQNRSPKVTMTSPTRAEVISIATTSDTTMLTPDPQKNTEKPNQLTHASPSPAEPAVYLRRSSSTVSRRKSTDVQVRGPTSVLLGDTLGTICLQVDYGTLCEVVLVSYINIFFSFMAKSSFSSAPFISL